MAETDEECPVFDARRSRCWRACRPRGRRRARHGDRREVGVGRANDALTSSYGGADAVPIALTEGFQRNSLVAAGLALAAALAAGLLLRQAERAIRDRAAPHLAAEIRTPAVADR